MPNTDAIRLTQTVAKGGCAAKVAAVELRKILSQVRFPPSPKELVISTGTFDDAAVYMLPSASQQASHSLALVQTLDFFTPIVDTPKLFGRIAAANALSDVYAMGGTPKTAMCIFAFPIATMDMSVAVDVLQGAADTIGEANAALVGGHTIDDDTLKFGLSVTGFVDPDQVWSNAGAKVGDVLILTKALGTGTLTAALKRSEVTESDIQDALESMCLLNDVAAQLPIEFRKHIHAATDITGFGLAGHALNVARASRVSLKLNTALLPRFERADEFLKRGFLTKAHRTNAEYAQGHIRIESKVESDQQLLFDPQTSGGLLLSVNASAADEIVKKLSRHFPFTRKIGTVQPAGEFALDFI